MELDKWDGIILALIVMLLFIYLILTKDVGHVLQKLVEISLFGLITGYFIKKLVAKG